MPDFTLEIPASVENLALPDPNLLNFYKLADKRIMYVQGIIDDSLLEYAKMIQLFNIEDAGTPIENRTPIKIFIFSEGGEDQPTWNLIDTISHSKTPVWTINAGIAMSNGLSLLVAGHKRFTYPHATAMYHSGSAGFQGTKEQIDAANKYIVNQDKVYEAWFMEKTSIDPKLFAKKKKIDWYLTADDMLTYKMVDAVINDLDDLK